MTRPLPLACALVLLGATEGGAQTYANVVTNRAGWPVGPEYIVFLGTLGSGTNARGHDVAHGIAENGWKPYVDREVQPLLDCPNRPSRLLVHCVGPAWPRMRKGRPSQIEGGLVIRWFEYDWPLTVAEGRLREDGRGRWPAMPAYIRDFQATWRSVANGSRSGGRPIKVYAYTGMIQTPWMEELRQEDPSEYRLRILEVASFFRDAGFAGIYVDAAADLNLPPDHEGLRLLRDIATWPNFRVGVEAYPPARHDDATGPLPYYISSGTLRSQHPLFPGGELATWQSRLSRRGLVVWNWTWGQPYELTPPTAVLTARMRGDIGVDWRKWCELAPNLPAQ